MTKDEMIQQLLQQVNTLTDTVNAQTQLIAQLNQTIQDLKEQLNKNSKNSSKPPSSDGFKKPAPKSLRKPSGKKVGGQNGHQGTHLAVITAPDDIVKHMPSACEGCPHYQMCKGTACVAEKRQVIDAVVTVNVTEHQALEIPICMMHGGTRKGEFPSDVKATVQYGENLQALSVALNTVGAVSIKRTHEILSGVFNIPIATGTISNMVKRCADNLGGTFNTIKQKVIKSAIGHFDETGTRVDKKLWWVHNASNCKYTYLDISSKRGFKGMEQCGVLTEFQGIAVHDCWASYWNYPEVSHAVCCAHLLRELTGITENHPEQKWAFEFIDLLLEMKTVKDKAIEKEKDSLSYYHYHKFDKQYDKLIEQARKENPLPETTEKKRGRKKKGKILALVERLANYKASVCLFIHDFMVPFDNNQAECDIRMIKVKTKVSGCFRTEEGARDYLKIMSYVGTAHKHGYNAYEAIKNAIAGNPDFIFGQIGCPEQLQEGKLRNKKDAVIYAKYPNAEIIPLLAKKKSTKEQKVFGELLGWLTDAPFGTDEVINQIADMHNAYYLVQQEDKQLFVTVIDEFIESKVLAKNITENKFEIGEYKYQKAAYRVEK